MTAKTILLNWVSEQADKSSNNEFYSYDIELNVPLYGKLKYGKIHTASTYSRLWRELRETPELFESLDIMLEEVKHMKQKKVKGWMAINMKKYGGIPESLQTAMSK